MKDELDQSSVDQIVQETIKKKPLESAGAIFIAGVVVGLLIGTSMSRR